MNNKYLIQSSKFNLILIPIYLLKYILKFICCTPDIFNLRLTNKLLYHLLETVPIFDENCKLIKKIHFDNHYPSKIINYQYYSNKMFINRICHIKNYQLHGNTFIYNHKKELLCKSMFSNNLLNGRTFFWNNNKLYNCLEYKKGKKNGKELFLMPKKHRTYISKYKNDVLVNKKIKEFNQTISNINYDKNDCNVLIKSKFLGENKISIINSRFHKTAFIYQNDRKLHLQFEFGYLNGTQSVTTRDNEIKYIGTYSLSRPHGKYKCFNNKEIIEEGDINISGNTTYINQYNQLSTKKYKFDDFQRLDGLYLETDITKNYNISFTNGIFDGMYNESYYLENKWFNFIYYNENNYRIVLKKRSILIEIEKKFGSFIMNIKYFDNKNNIDSLYLGKI